jgi:hypothetical protein
MAEGWACGRGAAGQQVGVYDNVAPVPAWAESRVAAGAARGGRRVHRKSALAALWHASISRMELLPLG